MPSDRPLPSQKNRVGAIPDADRLFPGHEPDGVEIKRTWRGDLCYAAHPDRDYVRCHRGREHRGQHAIASNHAGGAPLVW